VLNIQTWDIQYYYCTCSGYCTKCIHHTTVSCHYYTFLRNCKMCLLCYNKRFFPGCFGFCVLHYLVQFLIQFFSIVYTQILVLETQWPQHVTHSPTLWTSSAKLQAQFLLYTQIAVLKHTFFKRLHTILCIWHSFHAENFSFSQGTHCHSNIHTDSSHGQTHVTQFYN